MTGPTAGEPTPLVDAHLHLWDPRRLDYPWLAELPALHRPFEPADLPTSGHPVTAAVFVEAGRRDEQAFDEVTWVTRLAQRWPLIRAVVAHAPLEQGAAVTGQVRRLADIALVRGIRRNLQDTPPGFALAPAHLAGVRLLAEHGLTADLCVRHQQLAEATELVRRVPEVTFVLDHLGKPPVRDRVAEPWRTDLSRLAEQPNVFCKLSGLTTEAHWQRWQPGDVLPYLEHALAEFGAQRCMFGSDWPVATLATGYRRWVDVVGAALHAYSPADRDRVFRGTATEVYRLVAG